MTDIASRIRYLNSLPEVYCRILVLGMLKAYHERRDAVDSLQTEYPEDRPQYTDPDGYGLPERALADDDCKP